MPKLGARPRNQRFTGRTLILAPHKLPGAYLRTALPLLEQKLARGDYSLRNLDASVIELDSRELANVNTPDDLTSLSVARRRTS